MENEIKVVELFAGVGGFRLGLEGLNGKIPEDLLSTLCLFTFDVYDSTR